MAISHNSEHKLLIPATYDAEARECHIQSQHGLQSETKSAWDTEKAQERHRDTPLPRSSRTRNLATPLGRRRLWVWVEGHSHPCPCQHLPMPMLRKLKMKSILFRLQQTGGKERNMVGRRTRYSARVRNMKPFFM